MPLAACLRPDQSRQTDRPGSSPGCRGASCNSEYFHHQPGRPPYLLVVAGTDITWINNIGPALRPIQAGCHLWRAPVRSAAVQGCTECGSAGLYGARQCRAVHYGKAQALICTIIGTCRRSPAFWPGLPMPERRSGFRPDGAITARTVLPAGPGLTRPLLQRLCSECGATAPQLRGSCGRVAFCNSA